MDIAVLVFLVIACGLYIYINVIYKRYSNKELKKGMSGFEVARDIIDSHGLNNVYITESKEELYSKYDYGRKVIKLIKGVFNDTSLTSCAISAFEAAHAIQDKKNNKMFRFKKSLDQFLSILIYIGYLIIILGSIFVHLKTIWVGFGIEIVIMIFYLLTNITEKEAREIAFKELVENKIISKKEYKRVAKLLRASSYISIASVIFPFCELMKRIYEFGESN